MSGQLLRAYKWAEGWANPSDHWPAITGLLGAVLLASTPASASTAELDSVVVTATRSPHPLSEVPVETRLLDREAIDRSQARNLPQLLGTLPGVSASNLDDTLGADNLRLTLRGLQLNEGYGLILVDGRRIHGGLGAHGDYGVSLNQIPLSMIDRVEVVRGAGSALYGADAMAGVINIITRRPEREPTGRAGLGAGFYETLDRDDRDATGSHRRDVDAHALYSGPFGEGSTFLVGGHHQQDEGTDQTAATTRKDTAMGHWQTDLNDHWSATLHGYFARARRDHHGPEARHDRAYDDASLTAGLDYEQGRHSLSMGGYHFDQDFETGYPGFAHGFRDGRVGYREADVRYTYFGERHWLTMGAQHQRQTLDYRFRNYADGALEDTVHVDERIDVNSVYVQDEIWLLGQRLILVPGARYEDHDTFGSELNPKLAARLQTGDTTWRASIGRAFKSPTLRQLYYQGLYRHGDYYLASNPDLSPERAISANLSVERTWPGSRVWTALGVYRTELKDRVTRADTGETTSQGDPIQSYINIDRSRIEGIEAEMRVGDRTGWSMDAALGLTHARDRRSGDWLPYVPRHTASLTPRYVTASGQTGIQGRINAYGRQYRDAANTRRISAHQVVDLGLWHDLTPASTLRLDINNVFNSDRGESAFAFRQGRRLGARIDVEF
ncbi:TonB-dependent receptor plug domain-containing protein [Alkalilimnicola ehrlichii]|uniref:TonB-dependent receptor, plug n=1 Tax=Alkalilimnicola ehrlichii (strain ATCC BAA-1101 / DSM 17681 / MLHE-1) TaxID=187272 RepID=Q0A715_ALKEH|nr:TonB-dependent receptor, plug [Alkalilimnicola ehrlichii MLHE-1]